MSESLAAELLADFDEDEVEETEESEQPLQGLNGKPKPDLEFGMEIDDADEDGDKDEEMADGDDRDEKLDLDLDDDEETRKAKLEKMNLGAVQDVRSVAGLMKVLEPVLEVRLPLAPFSILCMSLNAHPTDPLTRRLDNCSKSNITSRNRYRMKPPLAISRTIQNTSSWFSPTRTQSKSTMRLYWCTSLSEIITLRDFQSWKT